MNQATRHPDVQILASSHVPVSISSLTCKSLERAAKMARAKQHNGLYVCRAAGLVRTYVAQEWSTGFEFVFTSTAALRNFLTN